jgi:hypothetical protein
MGSCLEVVLQLASTQAMHPDNPRRHNGLAMMPSASAQRPAPGPCPLLARPRPKWRDGGCARKPISADLRTQADLDTENWPHEGAMSWSGGNGGRVARARMHMARSPLGQSSGAACAQRHIGQSRPGMRRGQALQHLSAYCAHLEAWQDAVVLWCRQVL